MSDEYKPLPDLPAIKVMQAFVLYMELEKKIQVVIEKHGGIQGIAWNPRYRTLAIRRSVCQLYLMSEPEITPLPHAGTLPSLQLAYHRVMQRKVVG